MKKIKIAGHTVRVYYPVTIRGFGKENVVGYANYARDTIHVARVDRVGNKRSKDCQKATLLHEILHHVADKYSAPISEKHVNRLAEGLYQVLKDNQLRF